MSWWDAFLDNRLTGWGAAGILATALVLGLFARVLIPRGSHKEIVGFWKASSEKWEKVATEALAQNTQLIGTQEISKKFYTEQLGKDPRTGARLDGTGG